MSEQDTGSTLVLLVGSNPLPNFLTACALRPARVTLVYTNETQDAKDRLQSELKCALGEGATCDEDKGFVEDATCATTVRRVLDDLLRHRDGNVLLNYTGGTKVMSSHARLAFLEARGKPEHASYLDEGGAGSEPRLRFDDGNSMPLTDYGNVPLTLAIVLGLHGIRHQPRQAHPPAPTADDAREILCKVLPQPKLARDLYDECRRLEKAGNPTRATSKPFEANRWDLKLSVPVLPTNGQLEGLANRKERDSWFKQWYKFIGGEWLEEWLGERIRGLGLQPAPEVTVGFDAFRGTTETQLEIDVAVIRGHRSYFISCTTDTTKPICKSKLFEVTVRSRQLGGDLARAALVCLAKDEIISALQADVQDLWSASNTPRVFGLSDLKAWSDCDGKRPNFHSLKSWLES